MATMSVGEQETFQDIFKKTEFVNWTKTALHFHKGKKAFLKEIEEKFQGYIGGLPKHQRSHLYQFFKCCQQNKVEYIKIHQTQEEQRRKKKRVWECQHALCEEIFKNLLSQYSPNQTGKWDVKVTLPPSQKSQEKENDEGTHSNVSNKDQKNEERNAIDNENLTDGNKPSASSKETEHSTPDPTVSTDRSYVSTSEETKQAVSQSHTGESGNNGNDQAAKQTDSQKTEGQLQDILDREEYAEFTCKQDYWKMARLFVYIDPGSKDVNADSPEGLDISLVIKLMRNCKLFEFDGSTKMFDAIIDDRNKMMHSAKNEVSDDAMHNIFKNTSDLLRAMKSPACQKLLVEMPVFETEKYVTGTSSDKFMYLAEKALRMQTAALKYEVAAKPDKKREEELEALLRMTSRRLDTVNRMTTTSTRQQMEGKITRLKMSNYELQREANRLNYRVKYLEKQTLSQQQLREEVNNKEKIIQKLQQENQRLQAKVFQEGDKQKMQTELDTLKNESMLLRQSNKSLEAENNKLKEDLIRIPDERKELEAERDLLKLKLSEMETKMKELQNKCDLYLDQKNAMTAENAMLKDRIGQISEQKDRDIPRLKEEIQKYTDVVELYEQAVAREVSLEDFKRKLRELNKKLKNPRPVETVIDHAGRNWCTIL